MAKKPPTAAGYVPEQTSRVYQTCLYVATKLGDLLEDLVIVGGLVPTLLIDQQSLPAGAEPHVGTMDLDFGLAFALVGDDRYQELAERLRNAGFEPDKNADGQLTRQRWRIGDPSVTVDFLIEPDDAASKPGRLFNLQADFAAIIVPGIHLAFQDRKKVNISGSTIKGETAARDVWVCGAGAFVVLKALAFQIRGENKDAYDLYYVIRNYGKGIADVVGQLRPLLDDEATKTALSFLKTDFLDSNAIGPKRVSEFMFGRSNDNLQAEVVGFVREIINECARRPSS